MRDKNRHLRLTDEEKKFAFEALKDAPDGTKLRRAHIDSDAPNTHSFIKVNGKILAIANKEEQHLGYGLLGTGGFGRVKLAEDFEGHLYAIKIVKADHVDEGEQLIADDVGISMGAATRQDGSRKHVYVLSYLGTNLSNLHWTRMGREARLDAAVQCVDALDRFHKGLDSQTGTGYIHRDVKPSNFTQDVESRIHLVDYGFCIPSEEAISGYADTSDISGTPQYLAPELFTLPENHAYAEFNQDIFSLGVMLTGYNQHGKYRQPFSILPSDVCNHTSIRYMQDEARLNRPSLDSIKIVLLTKKHPNNDAALTQDLLKYNAIIKNAAAAKVLSHALNIGALRESLDILRFCTAVNALSAITLNEASCWALIDHQPLLLAVLSIHHKAPIDDKCWATLYSSKKNSASALAKSIASGYEVQDDYDMILRHHHIKQDTSSMSLTIEDFYGVDPSLDMNPPPPFQRTFKAVWPVLIECMDSDQWKKLALIFSKPLKQRSLKKCLLKLDETGYIERLAHFKDAIEIMPEDTPVERTIKQDAQTIYKVCSDNLTAHLLTGSIDENASRIALAQFKRDAHEHKLKERLFSVACTVCVLPILFRAIKAKSFQTAALFHGLAHVCQEQKMAREATHLVNDLPIPEALTAAPVA